MIFIIFRYIAQVLHLTINFKMTTCVTRQRNLPVCESFHHNQNFPRCWILFSPLLRTGLLNLHCPPCTKLIQKLWQNFPSSPRSDSCPVAFIDIFIVLATLAAGAVSKYSPQNQFPSKSKIAALPLPEISPLCWACSCHCQQFQRMCKEKEGKHKQ